MELNKFDWSRMPYPTRTNCLLWALGMRLAHGGKLVLKRSTGWLGFFHVEWKYNSEYWSYSPKNPNPNRLKQSFKVLFEGSPIKRT